MRVSGNMRPADKPDIRLEADIDMQENAAPQILSRIFNNLVASTNIAKANAHGFFMGPCSIFELTS